MWEQVPGRDGDDFDAAFLDPAVDPVVAGVGDWNLFPWKDSQLLMQGWLVAFDGQQVVRVAFEYEVVGVGMLGVHRIRGDHRIGQVDGAQQGRELR